MKKIEERIKKVKKWLNDEERDWESYLPDAPVPLKEVAAPFGYSLLFGVIVKNDLDEIIEKSKYPFWGIQEKKLFSLVKRKIEDVTGKVEKKEDLTINKELLLFGKRF